jgi:hypothetical protein
MRMKFYNELEQSWRKLKQDHPEVAKAIEESDEREYLNHGGVWKIALKRPSFDDMVYRAPMQTEADKFLEKWYWKKIWQEGMGRHAYHMVMGVLDHNRVYTKDQEGKLGHIVLRVSDNWQLWESPVKLDTRRVAGWWIACPEKFLARLVISVDLKRGEHLRMHGASPMEGEDLEGYTFSQDPSTPLDQWQTLEEICAEAGR